MLNNLFYWSGLILWSAIGAVLLTTSFIFFCVFLFGIFRQYWYSVKHLLPKYQWTKKDYKALCKRYKKTNGFSIIRKKRFCIVTDDRKTRKWWFPKYNYVLIQKKRK